MLDTLKNCSFSGILLLLLLGGRTAAQAPWEYASYTIHVWVGLAPHGSLNQAIEQRIITTIAQRADVEVGAPWTVIPGPPPKELASGLATNIESITAEDISQHAEDLLFDDKLMLLSVQANPRETSIFARELDCRTRIWGPVIRRTVRNPDLLPPATFAALVDAFTPITRIESGESKTAVVRSRAGGLISDTSSPAYVDKGDVLLPIIRSNDRYGKPEPGKITEIPWTLLQVTGRNRRNQSVLDCNVYSGMRVPIRGRVSARKERYALGVRAVHDITRLLVQVRTRRRDDPSVPLAGLEIYSTVPVAEPPAPDGEEPSSGKREAPEFLGLTDWRGILSIRPDKDPLKILYVKNGGQLLARLPMVPGLKPEQIAQVPDDHPRLQAEGQIKGLSGEIMDLVAQRRLLAARIRMRIKEGKLDEAETLMEEFRSLKKRNEMQRALDQQMRRQMDSPYPTVQMRIDNLYRETRTAVGRYLDPSLENQLLQELRNARQRGSARPKAPAG